ncbi:outer membrane beta-barrel protein [Neolewinella maritima]|nr:outer membrane beta-barrel protein [Neolewinella maritima]
MKHSLFTLALCLSFFSGYAIASPLPDRVAFSVVGQVQDAESEAVAFANVALYAASDSSLVKVETTDEAGLFRMQGVAGGSYRLVITYLGAPDLTRLLDIFQDLDLGVLRMAPASIELAEATVTAQRALVEVKPDRTVFNVEGTINAVGNDGLDLLRKAPGVNVDNNDNINVLGRSGVLVYVDGKRLPLSGTDLSNYLRNLTAEQIDRIDIITNPGAKYEAEGNAGIIDIRLKKSENEGANGTATSTFSQGRYSRLSSGLSGNYRNKRFNTFGSLNHYTSQFWNAFAFTGIQNGLRLRETNSFYTDNNTPSFRFGTDVFLSDKHTLGFLVNGRFSDIDATTRNQVIVYGSPTAVQPDSILRANNLADRDRNQQTYNLNYQYRMDEARSLTVDLDYGRFRNASLLDQPNRYFSPGGEALSETINFFDTPTDIDIYTAKADYEQPLAGGQFGTGLKVSRVATENAFLFYDILAGTQVLSTSRSNRFDYTENVYAAYLNYSGQLSEAVSYSLGVRSELTDATGDLRAFEEDLREPPVELNYLSFFPSAGITYQLDAEKGNSLSLNYGRRINRPDYNVLNPFRIQLSQLSYERGNPFLNPEIVDNIELGYTLAYRYNFKLGYSETANQITRLIGPDRDDPRASFISWDNLASQRVISFNVSAPVTVSPWWNLYVNASASHLDNQADYGDGVTIDLQAFTYNAFVQNTFKLPWGLTGEVSGYYSGPGVWGGVFEYQDNGSLNLGLQRKFLNDQLNVKLSANDILYTTGWRGRSEFAGLVSQGNGNWDSRRIGLSLTYTFGKQGIKSRERKSGLEEEAGRVN